jgi:cysteine sulfinate desulfinase/cysteine desulfurase-like protein
VASVLGPVSLFGDKARGASDPIRYRVGTAGHRAPAVSSLSLATAQARALALQLHRAVIVASDGTAVEVRHHEPRFIVHPLGPVPWLELCRRLLTEHG